MIAREDFMRELNSHKNFAISYKGEVVFEPFPDDLIAIYSDDEEEAAEFFNVL